MKPSDPEKTLEAVAKAIGSVRAKNLGREVWLRRAAAAAIEAYETKSHRMRIRAQ